MWPQKRTKLSSETPSDLVHVWIKEGLRRYSGKTIATKLGLDPTGLRKEGDGREMSLECGSLYYIWGGISYSLYPIILQDFTQSLCVQ